jgi:hypothetical protein
MATAHTAMSAGTSTASASAPPSSATPIDLKKPADFRYIGTGDSGAGDRCRPGAALSSHNRSSKPHQPSVLSPTTSSGVFETPRRPSEERTRYCQIEDQSSRSKNSLPDAGRPGKKLLDDVTVVIVRRLPSSTKVRKYSLPVSFSFHEASIFTSNLFPSTR